jgi:hypothetical protein
MQRLLCPIVGLLAVGLTATEALACRGPQFERTPLFSTIPDDVPAPVGLHVTLVGGIGPPPGSQFPGPGFHPYSYVGLALINRVVKGSVTDREVFLVAPAIDCHHPFQLRTTGFVFGEPQRNAIGQLELMITMFRPAFD